MSTIKLKGSSSGEAEVTVAAAAGTPTFTLPTTVGSANQLLKNSGTAGTLQYTSVVEDSSGNVGIGITSPTTKLHSVQGDASAGNNVILDNSYSAGGTTTFLKAYRNGGAVGYGLQYKDSTTRIRQGTYTDHPMEFFTNDAARLTLETNGNVNVNDGDLVIGTSGHGINFHNFGSGTNIDSNLFNDYEVGTYTPTITDGSSTLTYGESNDYVLRSADNNGDIHPDISYTKIGNTVFIRFVIFFNSSFTGRYKFSIPFAYLGSAYAVTTSPASYNVNIGGDTLGCLASSSTWVDTYRIEGHSSTGGHGNVPITANSEVYYNFSYQTSS